MGPHTQGGQGAQRLPLGPLWPVALRVVVVVRVAPRNNTLLPEREQDTHHLYPKMIPLPPPRETLQFLHCDEEWPQGEGEGEKWRKVKVGDETGWVPEWCAQCVIMGPYYPPVLACAPSCNTLDDFVQRHVGTLRNLSTGCEWPDQLTRQITQLTDLVQSGTLDRYGSAIERMHTATEKHLHDYGCWTADLGLPPCELYPWKPHPWKTYPKGLRSAVCRHFDYKEWMVANVVIGPMAPNLKEYVHPDGTNMSQNVYYHGCTLGAFWGMVMKGGFIAGPGACRLRSRKVAGAFCTKDFFDAYGKGQNHLHDFSTMDATHNRVMNVFCMPVVIELLPCTYNDRPTHMHGSKHCFEASIGQLVDGCCITAVHMNKIIFANFLHLQHRGEQLSMNPYDLRICGQNKTLFSTPVYQGSCGRVIDRTDVAHVSNSGIWYCSACVKMHVPQFWQEGDVISFNPLPKPEAPPTLLR